MVQLRYNVPKGSFGRIFESIIKHLTPDLTREDAGKYPVEKVKGNSQKYTHYK